MNLCYACAVQIGSGHRQRGLPCQDSARGFAGPGGCAIALADGAGSRPDSHFAARAVTQALGQALARDFDRWYGMPDPVLGPALLDLARRAVEEEAPGVPPACTLLLFAVGEQGRCLLVHLGDGAALGVGPGGGMLLSGPENGEEENITYFVSNSDAADHLRIRRQLPPDCHTVLLCSDGSAASLLNPRTGSVAPGVAVLARQTATLPRQTAEDYMEEDLDRLFRPRTPDDMSLAVLCLDPEAVR